MPVNFSKHQYVQLCRQNIIAYDGWLNILLQGIPAACLNFVMVMMV